jgi:hypothetical protein
MRNKAIGTAPPSEAGQFAASTGTGSNIIDEPEFLRRVPICRRTLKAWRDNGTIPWINAKGRRVLYHWPSCEAALLRHQRGGQQ